MSFPLTEANIGQILSYLFERGDVEPNSVPILARPSASSALLAIIRNAAQQATSPSYTPLTTEQTRRNAQKLIDLLNRRFPKTAELENVVATLRSIATTSATAAATQGALPSPGPSPVAKPAGAIVTILPPPPSSLVSAPTKPTEQQIKQLLDRARTIQQSPYFKNIVEQERRPLNVFAALTLQDLSQISAEQYAQKDSILDKYQLFLQREAARVSEEVAKQSAAGVLGVRQAPVTKKVTTSEVEQQLRLALGGLLDGSVANESERKEIAELILKSSFDMQDISTAETLINRILDRAEKEKPVKRQRTLYSEQIVAERGVNQYNLGGSSACTVVAVEAAKRLLQRAQDICRDGLRVFTPADVAQIVTLGVTNYTPCRDFLRRERRLDVSIQHLAGEEVLQFSQLGVQSESVYFDVAAGATPLYSKPALQRAFRYIEQQGRESTSPVTAYVFTRLGISIAIAYFNPTKCRPISLQRPFFVMFDSHPSDGAKLWKFDTADNAIDHLLDIHPALEIEGLSEAQRSFTLDQVSLR